jgi:hypothetical protein
MRHSRIIARARHPGFLDRTANVLGTVGKVVGIAKSVYDIGKVVMPIAARAAPFIL